MTKLNRVCVCILVLAALAAPRPAAAQTAPQGREGFVGELLRDLSGVEKKVMDLAKALPPAAHEWRPAKGVRSTAEVLQHIAADNYFLPALLDVPAPADTGITKDFKTAQAYEKRPATRDALMTDLEKSFAFLRTSLQATQDAKMDAQVEFFGQKSTTRGVWLGTITHLHEHLGQLIAYARSNNVTPPWSK